MTRRQWARRGVVALVWWLVTWTAVAQIYGDVLPLVLAGVVFGACAVGWLVADGVRVVRQSDWSADYRAGPPALAMDGRLTRLDSLLTTVSDRGSVAAELHRTLTAIADDRLRSSYGVDRVRDPAAAREVLGPELDDFVTRPPRQLRVGYHQYLSRLLTRIESL